MQSSSIPQASQQALVTRLNDEWAFLEQFASPDLEQLAQEFIDTVVATLRRDPRWRAIPRVELALVLADAKRQFEFELMERLGNCLPADATLKAAQNAIENILIETQKVKVNDRPNRFA